jgi:hypothetical protein
MPQNSTDKLLRQPGRPLPPNAGNGRPKGAMNKTSALLKDAILQAAMAAGGGKDHKALVAFLTQQAKENPTAFLTLLGKVLPLQVSCDPKNPLLVPQIVINGRLKDADA